MLLLLRLRLAMTVTVLLSVSDRLKALGEVVVGVIGGRWSEVGLLLLAAVVTVRALARRRGARDGSLLLLVVGVVVTAQGSGQSVMLRLLWTVAGVERGKLLLLRPPMVRESGWSSQSSSEGTLRLLLLLLLLVTASGSRGARSLTRVGRCTLLVVEMMAAALQFSLALHILSA